ncbi:MFS transporter [Actinomadura sp. WMMB 499]|uniref:MFS transporter n=1 Tax=Actinomadura sp. WMMB 499 TaxID=1219491 RepID=UPI0012472A09|nr:MFS transporter [Actinomadura sp. WMMB 499]QFG22064.1 MFS transporter [Actinomadura sp. WMMB 499]
MLPSTSQRPREDSRASTGLGGRDFLLLLAATLGTFTNYAPLLSVAPLWTAEGGAGNGGAGAATGVTMGTTAAVQLCMPWILRRFHLRAVLAAGSLLLGVPTFGYLLSSSLGWVLAVSAVRGVGFGMVAVAGSALVAELVASAYRGRAVGWYGIAVGLPQVVFLPLGVWTAGNLGFAPVFVITALASLLAVPLVAAMSGRRATEDAPAAAPASGAPRLRPLTGPFTALITAACALGGITTFLPLTFEDPAVAPVALFAVSAAAIAGRWAAGTWSDRAGAGGLLVPGVVASALGMGGFAAAAGMGAGGFAVAIAAAVAYGLGFGALQNDSLVVMFRRAGPSGAGTASTAWNFAYDAGTGIGAVAVGWSAHALDMHGAFAVTAVLIAAVVPVALSDARREAAARGRSTSGGGRGTG